MTTLATPIRQSRPDRAFRSLGWDAARNGAPLLRAPGANRADIRGVAAALAHPDRGRPCRLAAYPRQRAVAAARWVADGRCHTNGDTALVSAALASWSESASVSPPPPAWSAFLADAMRTALNKRASGTDVASDVGALLAAVGPTPHRWVWMTAEGPAAVEALRSIFGTA